MLVCSCFNRAGSNCKLLDFLLNTVLHGGHDEGLRFEEKEKLAARDDLQRKNESAGT